VGRPICCAIPDGEDLLLALCVSTRPEVEARACGLSRWRRGGRGWAMVDWQRVTPEDGCYEPTLVRDHDGALLLCARSGSRDGQRGRDIRVWRSTDNGQSWRLAVHALDKTSGSPVTINVAGERTAFVAANPPNEYPRHRQRMVFWPLSPARDALEEPIIVRDALAEFGEPASGGGWYIDHPSSTVVRLDDGRWRTVVGMRIMVGVEQKRGLEASPQTGSYIEEVIAEGEPNPPWRFA
jgi:hypothetical protein